jgi:hypothetical protein
MIQAVSMLSSEKYGCSPATHSPQAVRPFGLDFDQQDAPRSSQTEAGLKRKSERHVDLA